MESQLKNFSCMGIGGKAEVFLPTNEKNLIELVKANKDAKVIGNGSNILFGKEVYVPIICTRMMKKRMKINKNIVSCNCSCSLYEIFKMTSSHNLAGFEKIALIPATLGGAIKNNASCFGQSIFDHLTKIKVLESGKIKWLKKEDISLSYHCTNITGIVLGAQFELPSLSQCQIMHEFAKYKLIRFSSQPQGKTLGSIFKNPPGKSAGKLIEECNLKGFKIGDAMISEKHANIFVNTKEASFEEMTALIKLTQDCVKERFNILLEPEIEIISSKKE